MSSNARFFRCSAAALVAVAALPGCGSDDTVAAVASSASSSASSGSGGSGGSSSTSTASTASTGAGGSSIGMPTMLPTATGTCPAMSNLAGVDATFAGQAVKVWSGDPAKGPGPLVIYWYATGSSATEPVFTLGQSEIDKITALGGAVVAQEMTTKMGPTTGNDVWYQGDATIADEIVACAIQEQKIDPSRIHSAGYSAGALQTTFMWWARSGYIASVLTYSGGDDTLDKVPLQDPMHPPAALVAHGAQGVDKYIIDFYDASHSWETEMQPTGAFVIDCNDGGAHTDVALRTKIAPQAIQFFLDHPYGVTPEPYSSLSSDWPSYCMIQK